MEPVMIIMVEASSADRHLHVLPLFKVYDQIK